MPVKLQIQYQSGWSILLSLFPKSNWTTTVLVSCFGCQYKENYLSQQTLLSNTHCRCTHHLCYHICECIWHIHFYQGIHALMMYMCTLRWYISITKLCSQCFTNMPLKIKNAKIKPTLLHTILYILYMISSISLYCHCSFLWKINLGQHFFPEQRQIIYEWWISNNGFLKEAPFPQKMNYRY